MVATVVVTGLGALLLSFLSGAGLAVGYALGTGEWDQVAEHVGGQLSYGPAVLLVAALALAVVGWRPRWAALAWAAVAFVLLQLVLGETLRLPQWVDALSPFWHLSEVPVEPLGVVPLLSELVLAGALVLLALSGYRRRDVDAS
jgi:ABC-2 type transport system permease protein